MYLQAKAFRKEGIQKDIEKSAQSLVPADALRLSAGERREWPGRCAPMSRDPLAHAAQGEQCEQIE